MGVLSIMYVLILKSQIYGVGVYVKGGGIIHYLLFIINVIIIYIYIYYTLYPLLVGGESPYFSHKGVDKFQKGTYTPGVYVYPLPIIFYLLRKKLIKFLLYIVYPNRVKGFDS